MNHWFQFKQFTVHQDKCAMKVCTDACLFGAWVAQKIEDDAIQPAKMLDIGCGTGLLSLMLAQKTDAETDAVEIDDAAYLQAKENVALSPWKEKIHIYNTDILQFSGDGKYDLIICNPPFYENQLKSPNDARNAAMHSTGLSLTELAISIKNKLSPEGKAAVLLPFDRLNAFKEALAEKKLFTEQELYIAHSQNHKYFRAVLWISFANTHSSEKEISIKNNRGEYSEEFTNLLKDYYLKF